MLNILVKAPSCIARALNNFKQKDAELHRAALGRRSRFLSGDTTISWEAALKRRVSQQGLTTEEVQRGERARHRDGERATKKLPEIFGPDAVTMPWQSPRAAAFERWAEQESWLMCPKCERLLPQRFVPGTSGTDRAATTRQTSRCPHCASNEVSGYPAPLPEDVPAPLERLPASVVEALRPFRISCGAGLKAPSGYWVHTAPIRFSWKDVPLEERIDRMEDAQLRAQTKAAAEWLLHREESAYKKFDELQRMYLAAAEKNEDLSPRMPIQFMESVGIECAAWPHLYWETRTCETYVRSRDKRRLEKSDKEDTDEAQDVIATERRQSFKASYLAKLLSRVIGYGTEFELVQFIYDLWLYGGIGAAGNAVKTELRAALAGKSFSPEFWKTKHLALQDLQAQIGTPTLFVTVAPYEWTAPYHRWLLDEMEKTARSRTNLPAAESLHLAHILTEAVRGLLLGSYSDTCRECCLLPGSKKAISRIPGWQTTDSAAADANAMVPWQGHRARSRAGVAARCGQQAEAARRHRGRPPRNGHSNGLPGSRLTARPKQQFMAVPRRGVELGRGKRTAAASSAGCLRGTVQSLHSRAAPGAQVPHGRPGWRRPRPSTSIHSWVHPKILSCMAHESTWRGRERGRKNSDGIQPNGNGDDASAFRTQIATVFPYGRNPTHCGSRALGL